MKKYNKHVSKKRYSQNRAAKPMPEQAWLKEHFLYNNTEGCLKWKKIPERCRAKVGDRLGYIHYSTTKGGKRSNRVEWACSIQGEHFKVSRMIYAFHNGQIGTYEIIDHINNDSLDNQIENLRKVDNLYNMHEGKSTDQTQYHFEHEDGRQIQCRRVDLLNVDNRLTAARLGRLFSKNPSKTSLGWFVVK